MYSPCLSDLIFTKSPPLGLGLQPCPSATHVSEFIGSGRTFLGNTEWGQRLVLSQTTLCNKLTDQRVADTR